MYGVHGITSAVKHQRKALRANGVRVKKKPKEPYDAIHVNWYGPLSYIQLIRAQRKGKTGVVFAHSGKDVEGGFTFSRYLSTPFIKWLSNFYSQGDVVVCPSQYAKDMVVEFGIEEGKTEIISNGVDQEKVQFSEEKRKRYRERFGLDRPTVIGVGQVIPRKAISTFVSVARKLPKYQFVWYGHRMNKLFMYDKEMDRAIKNAPENVQFSGYVEDIGGAFSSGDLFFFPSLEENEGIVLLEAATCGLPMVVRDLPVYRGWLEDEVNCLKGETEGEFVRLIEKGLKNQELRSRLVENGKAMAKKRRLENIGKDFLEIYEKFS